MSDLNNRVSRLDAAQRMQLLAKLQPDTVSAHAREEIVAYCVVPQAPAHDDESAQQSWQQQLKAHLQNRLPDFMCPQRIVVLDDFPRLPNGKINTQLLPEPVSVSRVVEESNESQVADQQATQTLTEILGGLLGMDDVRGDDNFFELGGDSITAIQFVSMAREAGVAISVSAITNQASLSEIAASASSDSRADQKMPATGDTPLTAIQAWFFAHRHPNPEQWNLAGSRQLVKPLDATVLQNAIEHVVSLHPQLGLQFHRDNGGWHAVVPEQGPPSDLVQISPVTATSLEQRDQSIAAMQQSFQLDQGWMIRFALAINEQGLAVACHWVAHHLIVDSISVDHLLRQIESVVHANRGPQGGDQPALPYRRWSLAMMAVAQPDITDPAQLAQTKFFEPETGIAVRGTEANCGTTRREIAAATSAAISTANAAYGTKAIELIVAALCIALTDCFGEQAPVVDIETHGRDVLGDEIDVSATVGWFTTFFPFEVNNAGAIDRQITQTKDRFRALSQSERHYLIQRFLTGDPSSLSDSRTPSVLLNFSGMQGGPDHSTFWADQPVSLEPLRASQNWRSHDIEINVRQQPDCLATTWRYVDSISSATLNQFSDAFTGAMNAVLDHCNQNEARVYTASDFPEANISQDDLDSLLGGLE